jgi:hypothetical protein
MTIIATFKPQNVKVEILDVFEDLASVKAIEGSPFIGGDKWPVSTPYATVKVAELQPEQAPKPEPANLLTMALSKAKRQWSAGEAVWIFKTDKYSGAFLKECYGFVCLHIAGYGKSTPIFFLDGQNWIPARDVEKKYQAWAREFEASKAALK